MGAGYGANLEAYRIQPSIGICLRLLMVIVCGDWLHATPYLTHSLVVLICQATSMMTLLRPTTTRMEAAIMHNPSACHGLSIMLKSAKQRACGPECERKQSYDSVLKFTTRCGKMTANADGNGSLGPYLRGLGPNFRDPRGEALIWT